MQLSTLKTILTAGVAFFILSGKNNPKKVTVQEVTIQDVVEEEQKEPPPPPPSTDPPGVKMERSFSEKCFENKGLKYDTDVTIIYLSDSTVTGRFTSQRLENYKEEYASYEGTISGDKLITAFKETRPVVGDASAWTNKPWTIKKTGNKETLLIVFNSKNNETNKWEDINYEFELTKCH